MNEIQLKQKIIRKLETMDQERLAFLSSFIDSLDTDRQPHKRSTVGETLNEGERRAFVNRLRGKYAHIATSSDEFARKEQAEID